ncbi:hypothetical protein [Streptomyces cellulosae]|uniref:hypothetical protein n=1 Tax=Streptomyces cellulosae TaxID=1968 RepID=UPI0004C76364|nr:hypothetical protein [Streptomyces cellulosae]
MVMAEGGGLAAGGGDVGERVRQTDAAEDRAVALPVGGVEFDLLVALAPHRAHLVVGVRLALRLGEPGGPQVAAVVDASGFDRVDTEVGEAGVDQIGMALGMQHALGRDVDPLLLAGGFGGGEPVRHDGLVGGRHGHRCSPGLWSRSASATRASGTSRSS